MQPEASFDGGSYFAAAHATICGFVLMVTAFVAWFFVWAAILRRREHRLLTRCIDAELTMLSRQEGNLAFLAERLAQQKAQATAPWKLIQGGKTDGPHQG